MSLPKAKAQLLAEMVPPYRVALVEKTESPDGEKRGHWCSYVLENGAATIRGYRRGTVKQVTEYATDFVEEFNARRTSATYKYPASRGKKGAKSAGWKSTGSTNTK